MITRPAPEAATWTDALLAQGWPALALPLIHIAAPQTPQDLATLQHWRRHWEQADAMLFVSAAAVRHFFASGVIAPLPTRRTRFWAPGPGTARQLAQVLAPLGVPASSIDAPAASADQYDSEHLWSLVSSQVGPGRLVLIVRGTSPHAPAGTGVDADAGAVAGSGREWLIEQCTAAGAQVRGCVAYARRAPALSPTDHDRIGQAMGEGSVWLFSSSEALSPLRALHPPAAWANACALVTHPRIAATARQAGFGRVLQVRPTLADVVRALESGWTRP